MLMRPEVYHGHFQVIRNTSEGDIVSPEEYAQYPSNEEAAAEYDVSTEDVETVLGYGYRLSAPGYLDCTDWGVAEIREEAIEVLLEFAEGDDELEAAIIAMRD